MDLLGLLLIGTVLTGGVLYATWSFWIAWQGLRSRSRETESASSDRRGSTWFQHGLTLLISLVFLGVTVSVCFSIVHGESCADAIEALRELAGQAPSDDGTSLEEEGHRRSLHVTSTPEGERVTGVSVCYMEFDNSDLTRFVEQYPHIQWLLLSGTQVDDRAMSLLAQKRNLSALVLADTVISDRGLAVLKNHRGLEELDLTRTAVTDRSLGVVSSLPALWYLNLSETSLTDAGLRVLRGNTRLRILHIRKTQISDAGLDTLATLTSLRLLNVEGCGLSPSAIARLRRALPKCEIHPDEPEVTVAQAADGFAAAQ